MYSKTENAVFDSSFVLFLFFLTKGTQIISKLWTAKTSSGSIIYIVKASNLLYSLFFCSEDAPTTMNNVNSTFFSLCSHYTLLNLFFSALFSYASFQCGIFRREYTGYILSRHTFPLCFVYLFYSHFFRFRFNIVLLQFYFLLWSQNGNA